MLPFSYHLLNFSTYAQSSIHHGPYEACRRHYRCETSGNYEATEFLLGLDGEKGHGVGSEEADRTLGLDKLVSSTRRGPAWESRQELTFSPIRSCPLNFAYPVSIRAADPETESGQEEMRWRGRISTQYVVR